MTKTPDIDVSPAQWQTIAGILSHHVPDAEVWAFGSRAKWTARDSSDLDLAIRTDKPLTLLQLAHLAEAFSESNLPFKVDVVDWATTKENFRRIIQENHVVVQKKRGSGEWKTMSLEDCMAAIIDYRGKSPEKQTFGIPLVTAKIVKGGRIETPEEFIAEKDFDVWMRRGMPQTGDIVMTTEAPLGEVAQLDGRKIALAQRIITLRGNPDVLDNTFLKFLMQSSEVQEELRSRATGTTVFGIRQSELRKVSLTLPPISQQKAIAHILGTLDDKIELNRKTNETLEAMARAIFKSWFVDFDPVHAKAKGRQPDGMGAETAKLFPSSFEDSEMGRIPKGWKIGTVGDLNSLSRASLTPAQFPDEIFDHYSLPAFDDGRLPKAESGDAIMSNKFVVPDGCVLLSKLNPRIPRIWMPDTSGQRRAICSTEFLVSLPKDGVSREFLFLTFTSAEFCERFATFVTGTSGSHQRVKPESLLSLEVVIPPESLIKAFTSVSHPLIMATNANINQSRELANTRDALLPKLLSGELQVRADVVDKVDGKKTADKVGEEDGKKTADKVGEEDGKKTADKVGEEDGAKAAETVEKADRRMKHG